MAGPNPNYDKQQFKESNVNANGGLNKKKAYDLTLYDDADSAPDSVLVLHIHIQMRFTDGKSEQPATQGQTLAWTKDEKQAFGARFKQVCFDTWNDKWKIKGHNSYFNKDVRVLFNIETTIDAFTIFQHWKLNVTKTDKYNTPFVKGERPIVGSDAELMSQDNDAVNKFIGTMPQKNSAHEFGHMLSYRDEYPNSANLSQAVGSPSWLTDTDSIMNTGMIVRDRHYSLLADWLTAQFKGFTGTSIDSTEPIEFKVDGTVTIANAGL